MKWFVPVMALLLGSSLADKAPFARGDRQLDFGDAARNVGSSGVGLDGSAFILSSNENVAQPRADDNAILNNFIDNSAVSSVVDGYSAPSESAVITEQLPGQSEINGYTENLSDYGEEQQESRINQQVTRVTSSSGLDALLGTIPGNPGSDYPIFGSAPVTSFTCEDKTLGGYYADGEAGCQSFHICGQDPEGVMVAYTFLCPNGTIFNQEYFICDWWFNVNCDEAQALAVARNADLLRERQEAEERAANRRAVIRSRQQQTLQAQGSVRVNTVVEPASSYRAADASANVVSVVEPVSSSYRSAVVSAPAPAPIPAPVVPQETARVETVVRRVEQPAVSSYTVAAASSPVIVDDLAPAPSTNSVSASSGYLAAAADALPISSVPAASTVDTRVEEPSAGYRASEAASEVISEAVVPRYASSRQRSQVNPFLSSGGNRRGFVVRRRRI